MKRLAANHCLLALLLVLSACFGTQSPAPVSRYGTKEGAGSAGIHTVVGNETLWNISQRYKLPMRDIAAANNLHAPFALASGQRLRLPPPQEYKVRRGDTLYSVSRLFGVNSSEIASLNELHAPYKISSGQVLRLPSLTRRNAPVYRSDKVGAPPTVEIASVPAVARGETLAPVNKPDAAGTFREVPLEEISLPEPVRPEPKSKVTATVPKRSSGRFLTPVGGPVISRYGAKDGGLHNDGINIRAAQGAPVRAAENGVVVYAGNELKGSGNLVLIRHEGKWMTAYAHLDNILIRRGDVIKRGQTIGTVGATGSVDSPQLHFEVRRGTEAINPQQYLEG